MRNFLQFIWNNQFTFLFFLLEFIGFALLTSSNSFHESRVASASVAMSGKIGEINHAYEQYLGLKETNEVLMHENARLLEAELENTHDGGSEQRIGYQVRTAHVINSTFHLGNNYMLIDKGSLHGIQAQQGVTGPKGVVGIVYKVSEHYSAVMPIIHSQSLLSCKLANSGYFGIMKWDGRDQQHAYLEDIPNHVGIQEGSEVRTRGASGAFPPDLLVGIAVASERNESSGFQTIKVELATDFQRVSNVYVIENEVRQEIDSLLIEVTNE